MFSLNRSAFLNNPASISGSFPDKHRRILPTRVAVAGSSNRDKSNGIISQELQVKKMLHNIRQYQVPLQKYMAMMDLQERNQKLFYKLLIDNVEELLPIVYTPTVGEACQKYGSIYSRPQGVFISLKDKGKVLECLPVTIDVGTNNEKLLDDEFYIGLRQKRAIGQEYAELLHEFMTAVKQNYGERILIQFEDFANHNAFDLLEKYGTTHLVFNDDIQAGTGIAELIALEISKQTNMPLEETRKKIWLVDSKGLIVSSRLESLQHFKKPWAHEHEPVKELVDAVNAIKPTILIGTSGQETIIFSLSTQLHNPECTAERSLYVEPGNPQPYILSSSGIMAEPIFASGSPFDPFRIWDNVFVLARQIMRYIFPGLGFGVNNVWCLSVFRMTCFWQQRTLLEQVNQENFARDSFNPPI
ncbi:hypothetical protein CUMW_171550 [Citrus unshiu]|uniref:Malic enzyme N-terminal domain-containing protein n=1 Tax=Citrus unshiu TaxID=55188 RepID=A0A2H5PVI1_CITUN|nr:hypothetical protein CUMW_171550 [Citrus unshiu]